MTMRDIDVALTNMSIRNHNEAALQINLHGGKVHYKEFEIKKEDIKLSKQEEIDIEKHIKERFRS